MFIVRTSNIQLFYDISKGFLLIFSVKPLFFTLKQSKIIHIITQFTSC